MVRLYQVPFGLLPDSPSLVHPDYVMPVSGEVATPFVLFSNHLILRLSDRMSQAGDTYRERTSPIFVVISLWLADIGVALLDLVIRLLVIRRFNNQVTPPSAGCQIRSWSIHLITCSARLLAITRMTASDLYWTMISTIKEVAGSDKGSE